MKLRPLYLVLLTFLALGSFQSEELFAAKYANSRFLVETGWLSEHLNDPGLRILDVRRIADYEKGHIPQATHLSLAEISALVNGVRGMLSPIEKVEGVFRAKGINREDKIIVYDYITGPAAARVFWVLEHLGHENMALLNGGWSKWVRENREIDRRIPEPRVGNFKVSPGGQNLATGPWILQNLNNDDVVILDVRSHDEFTGKEARSSRGGHIPGAIHLGWKKNLTEQGTIRSARALRNMFYKAQIKKGKVIVVQCQTGLRAAQTYFVLRLLGYDQVRLYDGSWEEWGNDQRYTVETGVGESTGKSSATC